MSDLKNPRWMYLKAVLFVVIGSASFVLLLMPMDRWMRILYQAIMVWAFARAYYFAFYVIEHYIDGSYRYSGLIDFARYLFRKRWARESRAPRQ